jgi:crotonobetainyl-CoA:carnitine CoA-transferase CaiB-like acyl-CoA transferase
MANYIPAVAALGRTVPRLGRAHAQIVPYQAFECSDGNYVMVGAFTNGFWRSLCDAVGRAEWAEDPRYMNNALRLRHRDELLPELSQIFKGRTRAEWEDALDSADVPNSPVLELHETLTLEQVRFNSSVQDVGRDGQPCPTVRLPIRSAAWPTREAAPPPRMGEHTVDVLRDLLGKSDAEITALVEQGVTATASQDAATPLPAGPGHYPIV